MRKFSSCSHPSLIALGYIDRHKAYTGAAPARCSAAKLRTSSEGGGEMFHNYKQYLATKRYGVRTITTVVLACLCAGLLLASSPPWTSMSMAQGLDQPAGRAAGAP